MTSSAKRSLHTVDYRAGPRKRRKLADNLSPDSVNSTSNVSGTEDPALADRFNEEEDIWPAERVLRERGTGAKKEYLIEWDKHPITGETSEPSWIVKDNVGIALLEAWKQRKTARSTHPKRHPSAPTAKPGLSSQPSSLHDLTKLSSTSRAIRNRPIVQDSSSVVDSDTDPGGVSHTPSLALDAASSPGDDWGPSSPAPEIFETQQEPSAAPPTFVVKIPVASIDRSEYVSYHSSQLTPEYDPSSTTHTSTSQHLSQLSPSLSSGLELHSIRNPAQPSQSSQQSTLARLLRAIQTPIRPEQRIEVPVSSQIQQQSSSNRSQNHNSISVVKSSNSRAKSGGSKSQQSSHSSTGGRSRLTDIAQTGPLFSSAQPPSASIGQLERSQDLKSIRTEQSPAQSSLPLEFQTQAPPISPLLRQLRSSQNSTQSSPGLHLEPSHPGQSQLRSGSNLLSSPSPLGPRPESIKMDAPILRQSPRLQAATMATGSRSPKPAPREQLRRALTPQKDNEDGPRAINSQAPGYGTHLTPDVRPSPSRQSNTYASAQAYQDNAYSANLPSQPLMYDNTIGLSALPIQQSIEDEPQSSAEEHSSIASKASSSQVSLQNEHYMPQVDGISLPIKPVIGPSEYAIPLPAEGKTQSAYMDLVKAKRKTILKFIHRRDSVGSANGHPHRTVERNEMIELVELLHDAVTHFDLGLPGFATQYSIDTQEASAYAHYAGSKFVFLEHLIDILMRVDCSLIIATKPGRVQDLLVDFLKMKKVRVHRFDRPGSSRSVTPDIHQATLKVDIIITSSDFEINVSPRPVLMVAFDSTFDSLTPHIARIRELNSTGRNRLLPVLHLLVHNSSEHVDRCLRKAMPSPQRLKLLVRATYQARSNLGGPPSYVPDDSDVTEGRHMDMHDLQRGVRKSPNRKLNMIAAIVARAALSEEFAELWTLGDMPDVTYEELEDSPPKSSQVTTTANTASATPRDGRARSRTPLSRAGTPSGRKRLLDVESASSALSKRVRLSPARDLTPTVEGVRETAEIEHLRDQLKAVAAELATERAARLKAEDDREAEVSRVAELERDHGKLSDYNKKTRAKTRELDKQVKQLQTTAEFNKSKHDRTVESNTKLRAEVAQLKTDLAAAREDLKKEAGDVGALEEAREQARTAQASSSKLEKSIESTKRDFEFTRQQYQQASNRAAELGGQNSELEEQLQTLKIQASDEKRRLREMNARETQQRDLAKIESLEQENRALQVVVKKMEDKIKMLEKGRGVQTRGSSVQPPGSPGLTQPPGYGTRSRQGSPAPGTVLSSSRDAREALHVGPAGGRDRVSGLRNER